MNINCSKYQRWQLLKPQCLFTINTLMSPIKKLILTLPGIFKIWDSSARCKKAVLGSTKEKTAQHKAKTL